MGKQDEIIQKINELKVHFDKNLNNKYVKNIILRLDIGSDIKHNMGILLDYKSLYFDSKGTIDDLYSSIRAVSFFIREVQLKVLPNISNFTADSFLNAKSSKDPNDRILYQMAIKNYPMNIKILGKMSLELLKMIVQYDRENFASNPAVDHIKNFDEIVNTLKSVIEHNEK